MRIGIFGGTFNPPHLGHLLLAQETMEKAKLDRLIFMPCGVPPHKDNRHIIDAKDRYEMVKLSIKDNPCFEISDMEISSELPSYTANTLEKLKEKYVGDTLCFIVGADSLCQMEDWYRPGLIFERAEVIAAIRGGIEVESLKQAAEDYRRKYGAKITLVEMSAVEMSSSDIRDRIKNGQSIRYMVVDSVAEYIREIGIYTE